MRNLTQKIQQILDLQLDELQISRQAKGFSLILLDTGNRTGIVVLKTVPMLVIAHAVYFIHNETGRSSGPIKKLVFQNEGVKGSNFAMKTGERNVVPDNFRDDLVCEDDIVYDIPEDFEIPTTPTV